MNDFSFPTAEKKKKTKNIKNQKEILNKNGNFFKLEKLLAINFQATKRNLYIWAERETEP